MKSRSISQGVAAGPAAITAKKGGSMMRRIMVVLCLSAVALMMMAGTAFAYTDYVPYLSKQTTGTASTEGAYALGCMWCHGWEKRATPNTSGQVDLTSVLTAPGDLLGDTGGEGVYTNLLSQYGQPYGPHGGYTNTTDRCKVCHDMHAANGDKRLLPADTVAELCETCHDFTEGISVYGAITANGETPESGHWVKGLASSENSATGATFIPGGQLGANDSVYPNTGGTTEYSSAVLASGEDALTCTDCHTPHGNTSMRPFKSDRVRLGTSILVALCNIQPVGNTKTAPTGNPVDLTAYGLGVVNPGDDLAGIELPIDPSSPAYNSLGDISNGNKLTSAGTALAISLISNGALSVDLTDPVDGLALKNARLTRVASNKLLRDNINGIDLRDSKYGNGAEVVSNTDAYDETSGADPWDNGQGGAKAVYGSSFCYACHQGRIGNYVGGEQLDADFDGTAAENEAMSINHPTDMKIAYSQVGTSDPTSPTVDGLALSNKGFAMKPAVGAHPDGTIDRQDAPICQQCHEDSRDVEEAFDFTDTDKSTPFADSVNSVLNITGGEFVAEGNPQFQNFPHETVNGRLLVEGGDSNQAGGGANDDLCLNCHVPGSTLRINVDPELDGKDLNGYME